MMITTAERDRLYFQQERERLAFLHEMDAETAQLTAELCERLDAFDEIDEAINFEMVGGDILHGYSGQSLPWLQMRRSEAWTALVGAARRLQETALELEAAARATSRSGRLDHISRGRQALAAEALRVTDGFGPGRSGETQVNWMRVYAIRDGIDRLEECQRAELREEIRHDLDSHERYRRDMIALDMGDYVRDVVDADPVLQRALRVMTAFVEAYRKR